MKTNLDSHNAGMNISYGRFLDIDELPYRLRQFLYYSLTQWNHSTVLSQWRTLAYQLGSEKATDIMISVLMRGDLDRHDGAVASGVVCEQNRQFKVERHSGRSRRFIR